MADRAFTDDRSTDADRILAAIPASLRDVSGAALYTGLASWTTPSPLYLMGINPGGDPADIPSTVAQNAAGVLKHANYSAYRDERWGNARGKLRERGRHPTQRAVLHLFDRLSLDPGMVPTSNMVYARSRQAHHIASDDMRAWAEECWPFHAEMIERLQVRVVLCLGVDTANFVRSKVGANTVTASFVEANKRRMTSRLYTGGSVSVVQAAHPSRSCWYTEACDG